MSFHSLHKRLQTPPIFHLRQALLGCLLNKRIPCDTGKNDLSEVITESRTQVTTECHLRGLVPLYAVFLPRVILREGATYSIPQLKLTVPRRVCISVCARLVNVSGIGNYLRIESNVEMFCSHF